MFRNKLRVIKCYYNFLDLQMCYSDRTFDFESLLMVLDLLASFQFEPRAYYVVIILQCMSVFFIYIHFKCYYFNHIFVFIAVLLN